MLHVNKQFKGKRTGFLLAVGSPLSAAEIFSLLLTVYHPSGPSGLLHCAGDFSRESMQLLQELWVANGLPRRLIRDLFQGGINFSLEEVILVAFSRRGCVWKGKFYSFSFYVAVFP
jgi:hypothetical protein